MTMKKLGHRTIRIETKKGETGLVYGTSPDLKGLLIAARDRTQVLRKAPKIIAAMYHATGVETVEILHVKHSIFVARPALTFNRH